MADDDIDIYGDDFEYDGNGITDDVSYLTSTIFRLLSFKCKSFTVHRRPSAARQCQ